MWEYRIEHLKTVGATNLVLSGKDQEFINTLGGKGWELTAAVPTVNGRTVILFFKRPLEIDTNTI